MSWLYSLVFAGLLFSGSTERLPVVTDTPTQVNAAVTAAQDETERIEKTFPLNPDGRVCVSNVNGSITITAWDRNEVHLVAVKTADTKERLADVDINIDARPDRITIETDYGHNRNNTWRNGGKLNVDYQLSVPRGAVLNEIETVNGSVTVADFTNMTKVSAVNGTVRASNLRGTANLSTVNGEVAVDFERLEPSSKINLSTVNGRVNLTIPSDSNATLKADSLNGNIVNDFGLPVRKGQYVGRDLYGKIGSGDVQIKLDSVNGGLTIKRRNDGRSLSPATNLLNQKSEDEDWDNESDNDSDNDQKVMSEKEKLKMKADLRRANAEVRRANVEAMRQAQKEMVKIKPPVVKIDAEAIKEATKIAVDTQVIQDQVRVGLEAQRVALASLRDASFSVPRITTKSESFAVKGTPKVTVDAKGCSVRVRGWDKQEVQYTVTQFSDRRNSSTLQVTPTHSDSDVNIKIVNNSSNTQFDSFHTDLTGTRIEIFVPKKSNLKIVSDGEIRLDGVSGELEVVGADESVNIRDSDGKLTLSNKDGLARVVGFNGDVNARTAAGDVYLEGAFASITGRATDGNFILTLPDGAGAIITSSSEVESSDGLELQKKNDSTWQLGSGGAKYRFDLGDGTVKLRCPLTIASN